MKIQDSSYVCPMRALSPSQWALVATGFLHILLIVFFSGRHIPFSPEERWNHVKMDFQTLKEARPEQVIEEVHIPKNYEERGLDQRKYSVAKTNQAVNEATDELSKGERERIEAEMDAQVEQMAKAASKTGFLEGKTGGNMTGSMSAKESKKSEKKKAGDKAGKTDTGNRHNQETNIKFNLNNPKRIEGAIGLHNPIYRCEIGGKVVVNIVVNRFGDVVQAKVNSKLSEVNNPCLYDEAKEAALLSTFNESLDAPDKQYGTITYFFPAQ
ncbi:hypothetical protein KFE98_20780 [bacterium SCSIO 12741]|nr:hypothetical protein KFE98_20780 [bacterium SCSIO 12741]